MELPGSTPELSYLMAKWGSILPYRRAAQMLGQLLPISDGVVSHATLRRHALAVGARLDQRDGTRRVRLAGIAPQSGTQLYATERRHRWYLRSVQSRHRSLWGSRTFYAETSGFSAALPQVRWQLID